METKKIYDAADVSGFLGINLPSAYEVMKSAGFPAFKVGKKIMVAKTAFDRWLDNDAAGKIIASYKENYRQRQERENG